MKKKITAVFLSALMLFSFALPAGAAQPGAVSAPDFGAVVAAIQADLNDETQSIGPLARLSAGLLRSVTERLKNTEVTTDDIKATVDECSRLVAKVYTSMGNYASKMLDKVKDKLTPDTDTDTDTDPGTTHSGDPGSTPSTPDKPDSPETPEATVTFAKLSDIMKKYIFIKVENSDEVAELIAETCEFTYTTIDDGHGTVFIRVDIEENPEIFNYAVFRRLVEDLYAQQNEEMIRNGDGEVDYVMSYEHIAGELALHAILYAASSEALRLGVSSGRLLSLYRSAAQADLNVNEARLPGEVFGIVGTLLMNFMNYHLLSALGVI